MSINGYILAGGKSSRIGTDKGLIVFNKQALIKTIIDQMLPAVNNLVIVSGNANYRKLGLEVIEDVIKNCGPAGGIHSALNHSDTQLNFIVSCDMPFITTYSVEFIIHRSLQTEITLPVYKNKIEPVFGVYSKECLTKWTELVQQDIIKLQELITHFSVKKLNIDNNRLFNDPHFFNVNTKNELNEALAISVRGLNNPAAGAHAVTSLV